MSDLKTVGVLDWREARRLMINVLENSRTEKQFEKAIIILITSCGTLSEIKKKRKQFGMKPLTKEEIKELKK